MHRVALVIVTFALTARVAAAATCDDEAVTLRAHLDEEAHRARRWNTIWAILFGTAAAGQVVFALVEVDPAGGTFNQDAKESLYVGATKAGIGALSKVVLPLKIVVPARVADACADVHALRAALAEAGRREARSFWLTHLGGLAINLAGATFLTIRRSFRVGATSFVISFPVSPISAYTQPRRSWHRWREQRASWVVGASAGGDGAQLWLGGSW